MRLQGKILLALLPAVVGVMLTLAWIGYGQLRQSSEQDTLSQMSLLLDQIERQMTTFIDTARANVGLFSSSNLLQRYLLIEDAAERYGLLQPALLKQFASYQKAYPAYYEIRLLLPDGYEDTRLTLPPLPNVTEDESDTAYFQAMRRSGYDFFSTIIENPDNGATALLAIKAIRISDQAVAPIDENPKLRGYLAVTLSLDRLANQVRTQRFGHRGYLFVTDATGTVLFHPDERQQQQRLPPADMDVIRSALDDAAPGTLVLGGEPFLVQARWLHQGLLLVAALPQTELIIAGRRLALLVAGATVAVIVLMTTVLFLLLRSLVIKPIRGLSRTARAIGDGRLEAEVSIQRSDEIGDLATALREMSQKLRRSMTELADSHEQIKQLAYSDSLTGLPNRRLFLDYVARAISRAKHRNNCLAVLFLDLDDFKRVNDTLGHDVGDQLLQHVAQRLTRCIRATDAVASNEDIGNTVARLGGDEFIILLSDLGEPDQATPVAERIIAALSQPILLKQQEFCVGTSIGIAIYPGDTDDVERLVKHADLAMYAAKQQGKKTYCFYDADLVSQGNSRAMLYR